MLVGEGQCMVMVDGREVEWIGLFIGDDSLPEEELLGVGAGGGGGGRCREKVRVNAPHPPLPFLPHRLRLQVSLIPLPSQQRYGQYLVDRVLEFVPLAPDVLHPHPGDDDGPLEDLPLLLHLRGLLHGGGRGEGGEEGGVGEEDGGGMEVEVEVGEGELIGGLHGVGLVLCAPLDVLHVGEVGLEQGEGEGGEEAALEQRLHLSEVMGGLLMQNVLAPITGGGGEEGEEALVEGAGVDDGEGEGVSENSLPCGCVVGGVGEKGEGGGRGGREGDRGRRRWGRRWRRRG